MAKSKERLDKLLVEREMVNSRSRSQRMIMAGEVLVSGVKAVKPGMIVSRDADIELIPKREYVSRGGYKLAAALDNFSVSVEGKICADVGACTGGFTDVLLQRKANHVYAIDVGYGQLDWNLRQDERVSIMERTNARYLNSLPESVEFVSIDVSFISLRKILPSVKKWLVSDGDVIVLIKPQFEAGRDAVGKGGIVRDPKVHRSVLSGILNWCLNNEFSPLGLMESPITGSEGNREFLAWLRMGAQSNFDIICEIESLTQ